MLALQEHGGIRHAAAQHHTHHAREGPQQEGNTPAKQHHGGVAQRLCQDLQAGYTQLFDDDWTMFGTFSTTQEYINNSTSHTGHMYMQFTPYTCSQLAESQANTVVVLLV
jgi:hypothetical protein